MKKSKNELEFVEFRKCVLCNFHTDLVCVSCDKWFCDDCSRICVQCEQIVCKECYLNDLCCLIRPWGEKMELHFRDFYQNKHVDRTGSYFIRDGLKYGNEHRLAALKRSITHYVDSFDASCCSQYKEEYVRDFFPNITKYLEHEETRSKFVVFMKELWEKSSRVFAFVMMKDVLREELFSLMEEAIRSNEEMQSTLVDFALEWKELFEPLKSRGLLDFSLLSLYPRPAAHIESLKWIEQKGFKVIDDEHFQCFVDNPPVEVMEYLIAEKGMAVEYLSKNIPSVTCDVLRMIFKVKGMNDEIRRIPPREIAYDFESIKFLKSIDYEFDKDSFKKIPYWTYALVCSSVLKFEEMGKVQKMAFHFFIKDHDIKACKHMYPFLKQIRKRKIMTVLLCIKTLYPLFQKEIIWNIIDLAYSPLNERGSL